ncbi:FGGY-family carbohydrate kinase [uncultured Megasphaera sp.]|uniref:FGGY-family carbohydrate kinase n=1 Tax=Megasphaera massiliensis TaxID=1232428 RepID=UPI00266DA553|nr:glycerol kinase [uncultured Megasphaera sp.]
MKSYILGIDQSTQGTKVLLFDEAGTICYKAAKSHKQYIDEKGWVEHDPDEIWRHLKDLIRDMLDKTEINGKAIKAVGISNQRETAMAWHRQTGKPVYRAIVWQCARGAAICEELRRKGLDSLIKNTTGLPLSPYFSAAKLAWILRHVEGAGELLTEGKLCMGTMDSWLVYCMTKGQVFRTDFSNASRTQLFDINRLTWSEDVCRAFGIDRHALPEVTDSNGLYGSTDFDGILPEAIPIHAVFGDSHAALFGQACHQPGMAKATYGTGSSVMMNIGDKPVYSQHGLVTSLAWSLSGKATYVLEGNINYTGAAITWLKDDLQLIQSPEETMALAKAANPKDRSYFVPAFTGLGAPYWESQATGLYTGVTRVTGKKEMVRAVLDAIAYQINDVTTLMQKESGYKLPSLRVDGGPTKNAYLMQFQTDLLGCPVDVPDAAELSAIGAAYAAGLAVGLYDKEALFKDMKGISYEPSMAGDRRRELVRGWQKAISQTLAVTHQGA